VTTWIPLAQVQISERHARSLSVATIERYRQWLEQGREAPPVILARHGAGYVVRDGRHRVAAAAAAGHTLIEAELHRLREALRAVLRRRSRVSRLWGRSSWGRAPRLHRGGAGSTPAVSTVGPQHE
jgi:ParB-like nuclease domain